MDVCVCLNIKFDYFLDIPQYAGISLSSDLEMNKKTCFDKLLISFVIHNCNVWYHLFIFLILLVHFL